MIVFDKTVSNINPEQSAFASGFVGYKRLYEFFNQSASYWNATRTQACYTAYPIKTPLVTKFNPGEELDIVELTISDGRKFLGWFDANDNKITSTKQITNDVVLTAKWSDSTPITSFEVTNKIDKIERLNTHTLSWSFAPTNATNKNLTFKSSDTSILKIDEEGKMTALKDGKVTVTVEVAEDSKFNVSFEVTVYVNPFIDLTFATTSVVEVGKYILVNYEVYGLNNAKVLFKSNNTDIATVDSGEIKGIASGYAEIVAYIEGNESISQTFGVTVMSQEDMELYSIFAEAHNSDIFVRRNLNVAGAYNTDVYVSASDLLYNFDYEIDRQYEEKQKQVTSNHGGLKTSTEFICVHYTAGVNSGSTGAANASYFANGGSTSSIHYTTGNDGIFHILDDNIVGYHAGDGTGTKFQWINTGVKATENVKPVWGVVKNTDSSSGYYFTLNGVSTTIVVPTTGTKSNGDSATMTDPSKCFTYFGPAWKVVNGTYYMGTTYACFTQTLAGAISSRGGNNNSIGIETACNEGSDLWLTYQYTSQLVARLLDENNLDLSRVVGHNAFSGKNCPQTLLANNGELWEIFMECVEAEYNLYEKLTKNGDYTITSVSSNTEVLNDNGRINKIPNYSTIVNYTVTIKNNTTNVEKTLTFSSVVHGRYTE